MGGSAALVAFVEQLCLLRMFRCNSVFGSLSLLILSQKTRIGRQSIILLSEKEASKEKAEPSILSHLAVIDLEPIFSLSCLFLFTLSSVVCSLCGY